MKSFKRLLLALLFTIGILLDSHAQQQVILTPQWQQIGEKCTDCGSAFFMIYRSLIPSASGQYEAYVYAWSNSFDGYGNSVTTYISRPINLWS